MKPKLDVDTPLNRIARGALAALALIALLAGAIAFAGSAGAEALRQGTETPAVTEAVQPTASLTATEAPTAAPSITPTNPAPTLVPPTPLPTATPAPVAQVSDSALASVKETKTLRVGTYYNAYPFAWLNERGEVAGYEADILRAIGIELGVQVDFVQVTRHNAVEMLTSGAVDVLIGQQVHSKDRESRLDFSHPYYLNEERMVIRQGSPYGEVAQLAGKPVGVEIGSRSERALRALAESGGVTFDIRPYMTEGEALDALATGEIEAMVGPLDSLRRAGRQQMSLLPQPVLLEPYSIVMRRWDVNLRNLLNRSLQKLKASGRLDEIFKQWFPGETADFSTLVPVYDTLYGDERTLDQFNTDMPLPAAPVLDRIQSGQPLRVAGIALDENAPAAVRIMNDLNKAMIEEMARRWGAKVEYVPDSALNAVDLVANGQADIAVGVTPRWDGADRAEYSLPYIQHGDRLLVPVRGGRPIEGFADMLGTGWTIGYFADDAPDADHIKQLAEHFGVAQNIRDPFAIQRENEAIYIMVEQNNINAIYGDSLRLLALMKGQDGDLVKMLDTWYGDVLPITFAMPRNDADFRSLVDFTLQQMAQDGTYQQYWQTFFALGDPLTIMQWPAQSPDVQG